MLQLLFVLPEINNEKILTLKNLKDSMDDYDVPEFNEFVGVNVGFDNPHYFNEYFYKLTGVRVYRKYAFMHENYCVFVLEQSEKNIKLNDGYAWVLYGDIILNKDKVVSEILVAVRDNYNKSVNMPWVKSGFMPYIDLINRAAAVNNFKIIGEIKQIKNAYVSNVFEIPTSIGNLYQKIVCTVFITELPCTKELIEWNLTELPKWLDYDEKLNAILMQDMGGYNLPEDSDITVLKEVIKQYANIQKNSVRYIPKSSAPFRDYRVKTILSAVDSLPNEIAHTLYGTENQLSEDEIEKFRYNLTKAKSLLESLNVLNIPDVLYSGDVRPGNIRVTPHGYIFYDWAWADISHPFRCISDFLHIIRRTLPDDVTAKDNLIEYYLNEWTEYGTHDQLKEDFLVLDKLVSLFATYIDFEWVRDILDASDNKIEKMSADGWLLDRRLYYFCRVLKRFIEADI